MVHTEHNVVSILYALKSAIETHFARIEEGRFGTKEDLLTHGEKVLKKAHADADHALEILKHVRESHQKMEHRAQKPAALVSVKEAWQIVQELLKREPLADKIEFLKRIPDQFPPVPCELTEFEEILYHLSKNAIQAMQGHGKLILRGQISFSQKEEPFAWITLSDTGPGIPKEKLPFLFEPFFTTKPHGEGNGLGLYLVKRLVLKNGGTISVSSFQGCGTTFTLEFPLAKKNS